MHLQGLKKSEYALFENSCAKTLQQIHLFLFVQDETQVQTVLSKQKGIRMRIYFADGGYSSWDNSRVGYNACSLICSTEPFPEGVYSQSCEIDDCFTKAEAQRLGDRATSYVVGDGWSIDRAVRYIEERMLQEKKKG